MSYIFFMDLTGFYIGPNGSHYDLLRKIIVF